MKRKTKKKGRKEEGLDEREKERKINETEERGKKKGRRKIQKE